MSRLHRRTLLAATALVASLLTAPAFADVTLLNVSYDPTREFYQDFNKAFAAIGSRRRARPSPSSSRTAARASRRARSSTAWTPTW